MGFEIVFHVSTGEKVENNLLKNNSTELYFEDRETIDFFLCVSKIFWYVIKRIETSLFNLKSNASF